jgi:hypothetical protein
MLCLRACRLHDEGKHLSTSWLARELGVSAAEARRWVHVAHAVSFHYRFALWRRLVAAFVEGRAPKGLRVWYVVTGTGSAAGVRRRPSGPSSAAAASSSSSAGSASASAMAVDDAGPPHVITVVPADRLECAFMPSSLIEFNHQIVLQHTRGLLPG